MNGQSSEWSAASSLFSRGSTTSHSSNNDNHNEDRRSSQPSLSSQQRARGISFSEHQVQQQVDSSLEYTESIHGSPKSASVTASGTGTTTATVAPPGNTTATGSSNEPSNTSVPAEQERQILLLMLLAQVCALHDPTPRTFTVHVLELFERGILDRQSIHFLFELGLVPNVNKSKTSKLLTAPPPPGPTSSTTSNNMDTAIPTTTSHLVAPSGQHFMANHHHFVRQRSLEVSAIRSTLEHQESLLGQQATATATPKTSTATALTNNRQPVSWSAEHHPLSLSRYQREFIQVRLLSSGSFGHVFQATNKTDGQDYAVKRVPFVASGYSNESVQQVSREVQCLAACDHPNVVRFYTSWLEPSWMTGSGGKVPPVMQTPLLTNGKMGEEPTSSNHSDSLMAYFNDSPWKKDESSIPQGGSSTRRRRQQQRRFSFDNSDRSASWRPMDADCQDNDEDSEVSYPDHFYNDESDIFDRGSPNESKSAPDDSYLDDLFGREGGRAKQKPSRTQQPAYRYQICLFIQMQLCNPSTLADWIRARNQKMEWSSTSFAKRMQPALQIFEQICSGLAHVHHKGIVHRDLKPANIFASKDGSNFLIGDFGLSKLLQRKTWGDRSAHQQTRQDRLLLMYQPSQESVTKEDCKSSLPHEPSWTDPLTAGVGTASYASPEQVASRLYGKEADIFSLGLILLELLCCFSTEHERLQTFHDCRYRRDLPAEIRDIPAIADTILQCTDKCPTKRPTADRLRAFAKHLLFPDGDADSPAETQQNVSQVEQLKLELSERNQEVTELKHVLTEKDRVIEDLQRQLSLLRKDGIQNRTVAFAEQRGFYRTAEHSITHKRSDSSSSSDNQI